MDTITRPLIRELASGTLVKTTKPNEKKRGEWTNEGWNARRWGIKGEIVDHHHGHGFYYDVKHQDGTMGGYNPEEIEIISFAPSDISVLRDIRIFVQNILLNEDLGITYYNPFNKTNRSFRKAPDRYLVCFALSVEKRNAAFTKLANEGYKCVKGKTYEHPISETSMEKSWTFTIDLIS